MKRNIMIALMIVLCVFCMTSCARAVKETRSHFTYTDPEIIGGSWDVYTSNQVFKNCKCRYWGSEGDENACFETEDGRKIFINGTYSVIQTRY